MAAEPTRPTLSPITADSAFGVLGNETRIQILHTLGEADDPLTFSALQDRVGVSDSGQFNYHLDKLDGAFVGQTDEGYSLLQSGRRVIEGIYSGVLTDDPGIERVHIDRPCQYCGAAIDVRVNPGSITMYCTECPGSHGQSMASGRREPAERGYLGRLTLPPAGFQNRTPEEIYQSAQVWGHLEILSIANEVCPRCSAPLERGVDACVEHSTDEKGLCETCGNRYAIAVHVDCSNCIFSGAGGVGLLLYGHPAVQGFKVGHGQNLVAPTAGQNPLSDPEQEVLSEDPLSARVTYQFNGDSLTLAIDERLDVVEVTDE